MGMKATKDLIPDSPHYLIVPGNSKISFEFAARTIMESQRGTVKAVLEGIETPRQSAKVEKSFYKVVQQIRKRRDIELQKSEYRDRKTEGAKIIQVLPGR
ncbi:unnamed protein product [Allacma fusca]|uniref:Uncharacterized protein n=1 Tax=Allacma fusca TaxID=39272 RepID=A0A8J2KPI7_9HEXA|nr:unnamed protein product [Allacma fusca]